MQLRLNCLCKVKQGSSEELVFWVQSFTQSDILPQQVYVCVPKQLCSCSLSASSQCFKVITQKTIHTSLKIWPTQHWRFHVDVSIFCCFSQTLGREFFLQQAKESGVNCTFLIIFSDVYQKTVVPSKPPPSQLRSGTDGGGSTREHAEREVADMENTVSSTDTSKPDHNAPTHTVVQTLISLALQN